MSSIRHILVATDFSEHAQWARVAAAGMSASHGARVSFVHVVRPQGPETAEDDAATSHAKEKLDEVCKSFGDDVAGHVVVQRSAAEGICRVAEREDVDLIAMGTRGRGGFDDLVMGSVAEQVVRYAPCSVLTIGREAFGDSLHHHGIVVASDLSRAAFPALVAAAELSRSFQAPLTLVHVYDPKLPYPEEGAIRDAFGNPVEVRQALERRVEGEVKQMLHDPGARVEVLTHVRPAEAICEFLEERKAELVVLATHGRTGLTRAKLGSVAEEVVRFAPCPVLTVRRWDADDEGA